MQKRSFMRAVALLVATAACAFASGTVWSEVEGDVACVHHDGAEFNCCPEMVFTVEFETNTIDIYEQDTLPSCWCICSYDLEHTLEGLESGTYVARVWESPSPIDEFSLAGETEFTILAPAVPFGYGSWMSECYDAVGEQPHNPARKLELKRTSSPVQKSVQIRYYLPADADVRLTIYDAVGVAVRSLTVGSQESGEHVQVWDVRSDAGAQVPSGIYFVRLAASGETRSLPLVVLR